MRMKVRIYHESMEMDTLGLRTGYRVRMVLFWGIVSAKEWCPMATKDF
jgi:hypothetical protein